MVKPRTGSGSRGLMTVGSAAELAALHRSPSLIVQEFLPGEEYSVDVLADAGGHVIASVPRLRARVDSGVSVGGRTVHDAEVEWFGRAVAEATGLTYVANVQCKRDRDGVPALLEVNPQDAGHARADHRQRSRHAQARAGCAARAAGPGGHGLPRAGGGALPR